MATHRPLVPEGRSALAIAPEATDGCPAESRPFVLIATIAASAMAFIDGTVVNIALPAMQRGLGADIGDLQWVLNGYLLMLGALILVGGGLGDRIGRRRVFIIGIVVFTVASVGCAVAPGVDLLIAARAVQGIGAALLVPQSLALITANFRREIRGRAIGTWAAASAITTALGPPLGGLLIDVLSWRVAFWINLPVAAVAIWLALRYIPESRDGTATGPIDWQGALVATVGFGAVTWGLIGLGEADGALLVNAAAIVVGIALIAAFVAIEARVANPVMPPALFQNRVFAGGNIVTVLLYGALSGAMFLLPFELLARRELTTSEAGLVILPFGLVIGVMSRYMGALADKHGPRLFMSLGPLLVAIAGVLLALTMENFWLGILGPAILLAVGMGIVVSPLTTAVMNAVPEEKSGAASGVNNAASRLAGVFAVAIAGALAAIVYRAIAPEGAPRFGVLPPSGDPLHAGAEAAFLAGYGVAMALMSAGALVAAIAAWMTIPPGVPERDSVQDEG